jgi:hypothetical protein
MIETNAKIGFGGCGDITVKQDFDWTKADGLWYETYVDWGNSLEWFWDCTTEAYYKSDFSDDIYRISTPYRYSYWGISTPFYFGWASNGQLYCGDDGNCRVSMLPWGQVEPENGPNFYITDTDYDNFIIVYSCVDGIIANMQNLWIMTRTPDPSEEVLKKIEESMANSSISNWSLTSGIFGDLKKTYHGDDCVYEKWNGNQLIEGVNENEWLPFGSLQKETFDERN